MHLYQLGFSDRTSIAWSDAIPFWIIHLRGKPGKNFPPNGTLQIFH